MKNTKNSVWPKHGSILKVGDKVEVAHDIKYPTVTIGQGVIGYVSAFTEDNRPEIKSDVGNFICDGQDLIKITLSKLEQDLVALLKDIKYQTDYMTNSWGDSDMLDRMAIEDQISPMSIRKEVNNFVSKHNLDLTER